MYARFSDRRDAGRQLATQLAAFAGRPDVVVVALPRGGVPVAFEIAQALGAPLDICVVRKLGAPGQEEFAIGAIASGGVTIVHDETVRALGLSAASLERIRIAEQAELARREVRYRHGRRAHALEGKVVILVDDGLATGASMEAAVASVRTHAPARVIIAVPVASADAVETVGAQADSVVCVATPDMMGSVGMWYDDFSQVEDAEVERLLAQPAPQASRHAAVPSSSVTMTPSLQLSATRRAVEAIQRSAQRLVGAPGDFDALLARIGDARVVLLGEATHGTHEFYRDPERDHQAAHPGAPVHRRRGRGGLARCVSRQRVRARHLGPRHRCHRRARRLPAIPAVDVAQRRRARLRRLAAPAQRAGGRAGVGGGLLRARPLQPARIDGRRRRVPGGGRSGRGTAGARTLRVLRSLRRRSAGVRSRHHPRHRRIVRVRRGAAAARVAAARHRWPRDARTAR